MSGSGFSPPGSASRVPVSCGCARAGPRGTLVPRERGFIPSSHCQGTAAGGAALSLPACPKPGFLQETCKGHRPPGIGSSKAPGWLSPISPAPRAGLHHRRSCAATMPQFYRFWPLPAKSTPPQTQKLSAGSASLKQTAAGGTEICRPTGREPKQAPAAQTVVPSCGLHTRGSQMPGPRLLGSGWTFPPPSEFCNEKPKALTCLVR